MSAWNDLQGSGQLTANHTYAGGLSWRIGPLGVGLGDTPTDPLLVGLMGLVFSAYAPQIQGAAAANAVPVELLAAVIATETADADPAFSPEFLVHLDGYVDDNRTPGLVRGGCCGMFLSIARSMVRAPYTAANLYDPGTALSLAAASIASAVTFTGLQPPMVASAYNTVAGAPGFDAANMWCLSSYDGDEDRITTFVEWFNAAVLCCQADATIAGSAPNFAAVLPSIAAPMVPVPSTMQTLMKTVAAQAAVDAGMMVLSTNHPSLAGVWSLDPTTLTQIKGVANDASGPIGLPFGAPMFAYPDRSGINHYMTGDEVVMLYRAMRDYVAGIQMFDTSRAPGLPGQPVLV